MMGKLRESLAGPGYVILNVIRAINIIVFLDMIAACVVMLVKTETTNGFFFFEAVTHVVVALVSIFLIISELPILRGYFNRQWPLFGEEAGFMALAAIMMILGIATLGNLNFAAYSQKTLGLAFWRVVISAGVLAMIMSLVNILTTIVFTDRQSGVSARHVRAYGAVAPQKVLSRASSRRSFQLSIKREDSLPTYSREPAFKRYSRQLANRIPIKISSPFSNPNNVTNASDATEAAKDDSASSKYSRSSGEIQAPDLAYHPSNYSGHV